MEKPSMQNLTITGRILLLGFLAVRALVVAGSFGIFQISHVNKQLALTMNNMRAGVTTLIDMPLTRSQVPQKLTEKSIISGI